MLVYDSSVLARNNESHSRYIQCINLSACETSTSESVSVFTASRSHRAPVRTIFFVLSGKLNNGLECGINIFTFIFPFKQTCRNAKLVTEIVFTKYVQMPQEVMQKIITRRHITYSAQKEKIRSLILLIFVSWQYCV